jgi:glucose/mannose-6-phosphate isomerase
MQGNNPNGNHTNTSNNDKILGEIKEIIKKQSAVLYDNSELKDPRTQREHNAMIEASLKEQAAIQKALRILGPDGLLDNQELVKLIDRSGMLERLGNWPDQIKTMQSRAYKTAEQFRKKHKQDINYIAIFGLGGSAAPHNIAADIISNWRKSSIKIEVIHADTPNPDYIDENTLAIFSSFSGTTEEIINCYEIVQRESETDMCVVLAKPDKPDNLPKISLEQIAQRDNLPFIQLPADKKDKAYVMQPRESVCLQLTAMLTFLASIGLKEGSKGSLTPDDLAFKKKIIPKIKEWRKDFGPEVSYKDNLAKQLAFFLLYGIDYKGKGNLKKYDLWRKKVPCILVDRNNWAIGHEIRTQLHERSKINAIFYEAPEFLHNLVESIRAGAESSQGGLDEDPYVYYFIRSLNEEKRIRLRLNKTIELVIKGKGKYKALNTEGKNPLQRALFAVYFNAHMATYLALLNGFDPLPVPTMSWLKNVMRKFKRNGKEEQKAQKNVRKLITTNVPGNKK